MIQTPDDEIEYLEQDRIANPLIGDEDLEEQNEIFKEIRKSNMNRHIDQQNYVKNKINKVATYKQEYFLNIFKNDCIIGEGIIGSVKICEMCYVLVKMRKKEGGMTCDMDEGTMKDYLQKSYRFQKKIQKHHAYRFKMQLEFRKLRLERNKKNAKLFKKVSKHSFDPRCYSKISKIVDDDVSV